MLQCYIISNDFRSTELSFCQIESPEKEIKLEWFLQRPGQPLLTLIIRGLIEIIFKKSVPLTPMVMILNIQFANK